MAEGAPNTLGKRLRWLREQRGDSLRDVARRAGVTYVTVQGIEKGRGRSLNVATLIGLSRALDTDAAHLLLLAANDLDPTLYVREGQSRQSPPFSSAQPPSSGYAPLGGFEELYGTHSTDHVPPPSRRAT